MRFSLVIFFFFFNDTATTEIYTLSLHDALPIYSRYFLGSGKAEELRGIARAQQADVILVDHALSPSQERNLERLTERRVLDPNSPILDIFAHRADRKSTRPHSSHPHTSHSLVSFSKKKQSESRAH